MADLIDRQAAIDAMFRLEQEDIDAYGAKIPEGFDADPAVKALKALPSAQPEQKWISVKDRLPEKEKRTYWVCTDYDHQLACRWTNINEFWPTLTTEWHWNPFDIPHYARVVAWMPLPEPYREEDDG